MTGQAHTILQKPKQIHDIFQDLLRDHIPLTIHFHKSSTVYTSYMLKTDLQKNFFVIDELVPQEGNSRMKLKEPFTIHANYEGASINIRNNLLAKAGSQAGALLYLIRFPKEVTYQQRRQAFRVTLPESVKISLELEYILNGKKTKVIGQLIDISATGCKGKFKGDITENLVQGIELEACHFNIPHHGIFTCDAQLKHSFYNEKSEQTFCGVMFQKIKACNQALIARFVIAMEIEKKKS